MRTGNGGGEGAPNPSPSPDTAAALGALRFFTPALSNLTSGEGPGSCPHPYLKALVWGADDSWGICPDLGPCLPWSCLHVLLPVWESVCRHCVLGGAWTLHRRHHYFCVLLDSHFNQKLLVIYKYSTHPQVVLDPQNPKFTSLDLSFPIDGRECEEDHIRRFSKSLLTSKIRRG